jgi:flagellar basal-body rod protein FlgG
MFAMTPAPTICPLVSDFWFLVPGPWFLKLARLLQLTPITTTKEEKMYIQNHLGLIEGTETMIAQQHRMNQIANNLANVDTAGYKKEDVTFHEMLYTTDEGRNRVGKALKILTNHDKGAMKITNNQLDFAIDGNGFFKIQTPQGIRYTRAGNFHVNSEGQLMTPSGYLVMGGGGPLTIIGTDVSIAADGSITVDNVSAGKLDIVTVDNLNGLEKEGNNMFRLLPGEAAETPATGYSVKQGFIEASNVTLVTEMTNMLDLHRAYESQQKIIRTFDEMDSKAINSVGKLT